MSSELVDTNRDKPRILVAFEGVPALMSIALFDLLHPNEARPQRFSILRLPGNVLDITFVRDKCIVVSVDNTHLPGTTTDIVGSEESNEPGASKVSIHFQHQRQRLLIT